jgi:hypothetical protein
VVELVRHGNKRGIIDVLSVSEFKDFINDFKPIQNGNVGILARCQISGKRLE